MIFENVDFALLAVKKSDTKIDRQNFAEENLNVLSVIKSDQTVLEVDTIGVASFHLDKTEH